ncbi:hypothetical protein CVT24_000576 [Panaeolus cyanescens]|uniref:Uncharacterized protein n=1 Tax=Panaeolus cyanescens TaxID=181874 RepID=A0A409YDF7_9AGAR|nr:hypothetical protein CVT24_000576 [Panaeolus cyanescens]
MELTFNNKANVLSAQLLTTHDHSPIYVITTETSLWGRTYTYLRDVNPAFHAGSLQPQRHNRNANSASGKKGGAKKGKGGAEAIGEKAQSQAYQTSLSPPSYRVGRHQGTIVGMINWKNKTMDVGGQRRKLVEVRRKEGGGWGVGLMQWSKEKVKGLGMCFGLAEKEKKAVNEGEVVEQENAWETKEKHRWSASTDNTEGDALGGADNDGTRDFWARRKRRLWQWASDRTEYCIEHEDEGWRISTTTSPRRTTGIFIVPYRPKLFGPMRPVTLKLTREALVKDEVFLILALVYEETMRGDRNVSL